MLSDPASVTEETLDIQADCVRRTRFNRRKVSGGSTLLLVGEIREAVGALDVHRIPRAGHWSAYENAPEVNRLTLEFFRNETASR